MSLHHRLSWLKYQAAKDSSRRLHVEALEDRRLLATFLVTNTMDSGAGSLREAVSMANLSPGVDTIEFDGAIAAATIGLTSGELTITDSVEIVGSSQTIDGTDTSRVFSVNDGLAAVDSVTISDLTIRGGIVTGTGGGIFNAEDLTLIGVDVVENTATGTGALLTSHGGGIFNIGALEIIDSTISNNSAINTDLAASSYAFGGGVASFFNGSTLTISGTTISDNTAIRGSGGGVFVGVGANQLSITNSVISGNTAGHSLVANGPTDQRAGDSGGGISVQGNDLFSSGALSVFIGDTDIEYNDVHNDLSLMGGSVTPSGGGLYVSGYGSVTVQDSTFNYNEALYTDETGAILGRPLMTGGNARGGGLVLKASSDSTSDAVLSAVIDPTVFTNNGSDGIGGGVVFLNDGDDYLSVDVLDATIDGNVAMLPGGGAYLGGGATALARSSSQSQVAGVRFHRTSITNNSSQDDGGGIWVQNVNLGIFNSSISGNTSMGKGGAIWSEQPLDNSTSTDVAFATITGNSVIGDSLDFGLGGGIEHIQGPFNLTGVILADNHVVDSEMSSVPSDFSEGMGTAVSNSSLFTSSNSHSFTGTGGNLIDVAAMLGSQVCLDVNDDMVAVESCHYPLSAGSPARDAVMGSTWGEDQLRALRLVGTNIRDMGAIESAGGINASPGDLNGDGAWNAADIDILTNAISNGSTDLVYDLNIDGIVDLEDINGEGGWLELAGTNNAMTTAGGSLLMGDANLDGSVDEDDFDIWTANRFAVTSDWTRGDFNSDGAVGLADLHIWNENKFTTAVATIYYDDFSGSTTTRLNNTAPDDRPGSELWVATDPLKADGTLDGSSAQSAGYLPFTPEINRLYQLSVDIDPISGGANWMAMGFSQKLDTGSVTNAMPGPWMLQRADRFGNDVQTFGTSGTADHSPNVSGPVRLTIELNTSTSPWTATWYHDDVELRGSTAVTNENINYIFIGSCCSSVSGTVDNLSLTSEAVLVDVFADEFSGSGASPLNGTAPDTRPGTETWVATSNLFADGTLDDTGILSSGYLPFTPTSDRLYRLSVDANPTSGGANWMAMGFSQNVTAGSVVNWASGPWMLQRADRASSGDVQTFVGTGATGTSNHSPGILGAVTLTIELDTKASPWTATWYHEETLLRGPTNLVNEDINFVFIGSCCSAVSGTFDSFSLAVGNSASAAPLADAKETYGLEPVVADAVAARMAGFESRLDRQVRFEVEESVEYGLGVRTFEQQVGAKMDRMAYRCRRIIPLASHDDASIRDWHESTLDAVWQEWDD